MRSRAAGNPVRTKSATYTAMPAPAAGACRSMAADRKTMSVANIAASASHASTDSMKRPMCAVSKRAT